MKKPGSPEASRALSECVVRFREGNGSCVHRLGMPGGGPFCVARCRVCFDHSLSQVSLLGRNLITVFLCVNNLEHFFSTAWPAMDAAAGAHGGRRRPKHWRRRFGRAKHAMRKPHFSRGFVRAAHRDVRARALRRIETATHNGSPTGHASRCMRGAKKRAGLRVAQARLRGFARSIGMARGRRGTHGRMPRHPHARPGRRCRNADATPTMVANIACAIPGRCTRRNGRCAAGRLLAACRGGSITCHEKRERPRISAAFRRCCMKRRLSGRPRAGRRSRRPRAGR